VLPALVARARTVEWAFAVPWADATWAPRDAAVANNATTAAEDVEYFMVGISRGCRRDRAP
jgi:hypothetical protein